MTSANNDTSMASGPETREEDLSLQYDTQPPLAHVSLNPSGKETLVFLHGLWSSHLEWALVTPHLSEYHLLLVDLPGHGGSAHLADDPKNLTIPVMADRVASLIRRYAHPATTKRTQPEGDDQNNKGGKAHIIGLSMGGFVTMSLASRYPSLCLSAFVTGAAPFEGLFAFMATYPSLVYAIMWIFAKTPDSVYWWISEKSGLKRLDELREEQKKHLRWEVIRGVYTSVLDDCSYEKGWDIIRGLDKVRMVNVAGGALDDLGSSGKIRDAWREVGVLGKDAGLGSRVVVVRGAVHAWDLQMPDLFGKGVLAWVRGEELPVEFEDL